MAAVSERSLMAAVGSGTTVPTRPMALSFSTPVGSPAASRTISPPSTSAVARSTPAAARAAELASAMCPSSRFTQTGWSDVTASTHCRVGSSPPHSV
jgi:hypothetical protein